MLALEENFKKNGGHFKEISMKELFDIRPTRAYRATNIALFRNKGNSPVVSNTAANNGIIGYSDMPVTENGNIITFSDTTDANSIFYQERPFVGYSHVQGVYPKEPSKWGKLSLLYIVSLFRHEAFKRGFSYGNKFRRTIAQEFNLYLPVNSHEEVDTQFMEDYVRELEEDYVRELDAYLKSAGLEDYELSKEEKNLLREAHQKTEFSLNQLFQITSSKKKFNANSIKFGGSYPYVSRGASANGIRGYIDESKAFLNEGKTISFGQDTATVYYQEKPFFTGDKIKIFNLKNDLPDENLGLYFVTAIKKSFSNYGWSTTSYSESVLNNEKINLPILSNGDIDCEYMRDFIRVVKKLVISDVVEYKNEYLAQTKNVVEC